MKCESRIELRLCLEVSMLSAGDRWEFGFSFTFVGCIWSKIGPGWSSEVTMSKIPSLDERGMLTPVLLATESPSRIAATILRRSSILRVWMLSASGHDNLNQTTYPNCIHPDDEALDYFCSYQEKVLTIFKKQRRQRALCSRFRVFFEEPPRYGKGEPENGSISGYRDRSGYHANYGTRHEYNGSLSRE